MNSMTDMFKSMDNSMIKNMMKMQGLDISDQQLELMKNNMNTNMLKMMSKSPYMDNAINNIPNNGNQTNVNVNASIATTNNSSNTSAQINNNIPTNIPNFGDLSKMDMGSMMKFVQDNPQMLNMMGPQFANMFGKEGSDPDVMRKSMESILWLITMPQRVKAYFTSTQGKLLILFILILIIAYFYR